MFDGIYCFQKTTLEYFERHSTDAFLETDDSNGALDFFSKNYVYNRNIKNTEKSSRHFTKMS